MILQNWEMFANTADPVVGATVTAHIAANTHPNPAVAVATTSTDSNGMWEFAALADGNVYDVKIVAGSSVKWYKGNAKVSLGHLYDDTAPDPNRNLLKNGGQQAWGRWTKFGSVPTVLSHGIEAADGWIISFPGSGDSGTVTRGTPSSGVNAQFAAVLTYTRVGGQVGYGQTLPTWMAYALRGKTISTSAQIEQSGNLGTRITITDDGGTTFGTGTTTTGSAVTVTATRAISATATSVRVEVNTGAAIIGTFTLRIMNLVADYGSVAPVYAVEVPDHGLGFVDSDRLIGLETVNDATGVAYADQGWVSEHLSFFGKRIKEIIGGSGWKDAIPRTLTQIVADLATKANIAGQAFTGSISAINNVIAVNSGTTSGAFIVQAPSATYSFTITLDANNLYLTSTVGGAQYVFPRTVAGSMSINGRTAWDSGNDGYTSGLVAQDSAQLGGVVAAAYALLSGATFTGAVSAVNNMTVFNQGATPGVVRVVSPAGASQYGEFRDDGSNIGLFSNTGATFFFPRNGTGGIACNGNTYWHTGNDGHGSTLDADTLDTFHAGSGVNQIPINNGFINATLNADLVDGLHAGNGPSQIPISNGTLNTNLNADLLDGQHGTFYQARANHTGTQAPATISPQGVASNLDADTVDGQHASAFAASGHGHAAMARLAAGNYTGNGAGAGAKQTISGLPFGPSLVWLQQLTGGSRAGILGSHDLVLWLPSPVIGFSTGNALTGDGFTVDGGSGFTASGQTFHYVAIG